MLPKTKTGQKIIQTIRKKSQHFSPNKNNTYQLSPMFDQKLKKIDNKDYIYEDKKKTDLLNNGKNNKNSNNNRSVDNIKKQDDRVIHFRNLTHCQNQYNITFPPTQNKSIKSMSNLNQQSSNQPHKYPPSPYFSTPSQPQLTQLQHQNYRLIQVNQSLQVKLKQILNLIKKNLKNIYHFLNQYLYVDAIKIVRKMLDFVQGQCKYLYQNFGNQYKIDKNQYDKSNLMEFNSQDTKDPSTAIYPNQKDSQIMQLSKFTPSTKPTKPTSSKNNHQQLYRLIFIQAAAIQQKLNFNF